MICPSTWERKSVMNYMENNKPVTEAAGRYIYEQEDLITSRPGRESLLLDRFIDRTLTEMEIAIRF